MKTTVLILIVLFTFNVYFLKAAISDPVYKSPSVKSELGISYMNLAPATPKEADFNDVEPVVERNYDILRPMTPKEASFDEQIGIEKSNSLEKLLKRITPVTPDSADFNENDDTGSVKMPSI